MCCFQWSKGTAVYSNLQISVSTTTVHTTNLTKTTKKITQARWTLFSQFRFRISPWPCTQSISFTRCKILRKKKKQKSFQAISNHLPHNPAWTLTYLCCYPHCFPLLPYALSAKQDNHGRSHGISLTGFCERHIIYLWVRAALYLCAHLRAFLALAYHREPSPTSWTRG